MGARNNTNQNEVIAFLGEPASHTPRPDAVDRIDTHGAIVFLAGDRAFKMKRAVKLAYLDFSTLEKRRLACEREVEINRLTAPQIYLRTVAITRRSDGVLQIGGKGEVVEWAVEMARFDQRDLLDRMAVEERLPVALMTPLADHIAAYHETAPVDRTSDGVTGLKGVVGSITAALYKAEGDLDKIAVDKYARALESEFAKVEGLLTLRAAKGHVRRCHGDLHLRNIVLLDGKPTLFDAIEFDEQIATIDVLYDLAFLLMDLWHRNEKRHASAVFNRYLWRGGVEENIEGLAALPLFLSIRAGVRAMVALDRLPVVSGAGVGVAVKEAGEYFDLAEAFLAPVPPRLIAVGGLSGTGKSTLAAALAPYIGRPPGAFHLRSDVERKLLFGVNPEEPLGDAAYTDHVTGRVYATLNDKAKLALSVGHSVVLDAVFARASQRDMAQQVGVNAGVPFDGLWLSASASELLQRVDKRGRDASDADTAVVKKQLERNLGELDWHTLDAGGPRETVVAAAGNALGVSIPEG